MIVAFFIFFIFSILLVIAAYKDATSMTIPNWISLAMIAGFIVMIPFTWQGLPELGTHLAVGGAFLAAGFAMFAFGWLGGGDAKLMAATALWMTWPDALQFVLYTTLFGAALGLFLMIGRKFIPVRVLTSQWMYTMFKDETKMPYGLAIAAGGIMTLPNSAIFMAAIGA
jgi:prepilin peptidase CpaA